MTDEEIALLDLTADVWNLFVTLPQDHPDEPEEFKTKLHDLQHMILARPARRELARRELLRRALDEQAAKEG